MNIIPNENIWTPDPEKYNIILCIGNDFAGLQSTISHFVPKYLVHGCRAKEMRRTLERDPMLCAFSVL